MKNILHFNIWYLFKIKICYIPIFLLKKSMKSITCLTLFENYYIIYNLVNNFNFSIDNILD